MPSDVPGRIINISGTASTTSGAMLTPADECGDEPAAGYLAADSRPQITVNTVVPGLVGTEGRKSTRTYQQ